MTNENQAEQSCLRQYPDPETTCIAVGDGVRGTNYENCEEGDAESTTGSQTYNLRQRVRLHRRIALVPNLSKAKNRTPHHVRKTMQARIRSFLIAGMIVFATFNCNGVGNVCKDQELLILGGDHADVIAVQDTHWDDEGKVFCSNSPNF